MHTKRKVKSDYSKELDKLELFVLKTIPFFINSRLLLILKKRLRSEFTPSKGDLISLLRKGRHQLETTKSTKVMKKMEL